MKGSHFTENQIVDALKRHENGPSTANLVLKYGITPAMVIGL